MADTISISAKCLCGAVTLSAADASTHLEACHCGMCRKWGGGPLMGMSCSELDIDGEAHVGVYDSSAWAQRCFCTNCGTHLYYRIKGKPEYFVPAGFYEAAGELEFTEEIFIDEKPAYYAFANETRKMTGAEVFARYAPKD